MGTDLKGSFRLIEGRDDGTKQAIALRNSIISVVAVRGASSQY